MRGSRKQEERSNHSRPSNPTSPNLSTALTSSSYKTPTCPSFPCPLSTHFPSSYRPAIINTLEDLDSRLRGFSLLISTVHQASRTFINTFPFATSPNPPSLLRQNTPNPILASSYSLSLLLSLSQSPCPYSLFFLSGKSYNHFSSTPFLSLSFPSLSNSFLPLSIPRPPNLYIAIETGAMEGTGCVCGLGRWSIGGRKRRHLNNKSQNHKSRITPKSQYQGPGRRPYCRPSCAQGRRVWTVQSRAKLSAVAVSDIESFYKKITAPQRSLC